jgi:hypothetical protein
MNIINNYTIALLASAIFVLVDSILIEDDFDLEEIIKEFILCYILILGSIYILSEVKVEIKQGEPIITGVPSFSKFNSTS